MLNNWESILNEENKNEIASTWRNEWLSGWEIETSVLKVIPWGKFKSERKDMKKKHKYVYILLEHAVTGFDFQDAKIHGVYLSSDAAKVARRRATYDSPRDRGYMAILKFRIRGNV